MTVKLLTALALSAMIMSFNVAQSSKLCKAPASTTHEGSNLVWKSEEIDLGNIPQGKPVTVQFEFTNKGKEAVLITNVATSCGCTLADYSKKPIAVDEASTITATYNAASLGAFTKAITVTLADNETKVLRIKGTVI